MNEIQILTRCGYLDPEQNYPGDASTHDRKPTFLMTVPLISEERFLVLVVKDLSNLTSFKVVSPYVEHKVTEGAKLRFKGGTLLD